MMELTWTGANTRVGVVRCYNPVQGQPCQAFYWVLDSLDETFSCLVAGCHPVATYPAPFAFGGLDGDRFITGDWLGTGVTRAAVFRGGWYLDGDGNHSYNFFVTYGPAAGEP